MRILNAQNTEDPKSNKGNLTFPKHTVNVIELWSNNESGNPLPHFYISSPYYPPFLAKILYPPPPSDWNFGRSQLPPLIRGGGFQIWIVTQGSKYATI